MDSQAPPQPITCEVCGTCFETRRGLSSHARLHLRQLGVTVSETSGAPIDLLYQYIQQRDGFLPVFKGDSPLPSLTNPKKTPQQDPRKSTVPQDKSSSSKAAGKITSNPPKKSSEGSPANLRESGASPFPSSSRIIEGSSSSSLELSQTATKPLWAPLETDAPITLASHTSNEVHVCQLCGCWYETRKGLSSHARAHLRQIGISESEIAGSPIEFLYKIMKDQDLKPIDSTQELFNSHSLSQSKYPSSPHVTTGSHSSTPAESPPSKRPKSSEEFTCVLCGEEFGNRKGLASHSRSHLREMGVTDLLGTASAIDTVQELVNSGVLCGINPLKTKSIASSSAASSPAPPLSPSAAQSSSPFLSPALSPSPVKYTQSPPLPVNRAPKAKKGSRLAVDPLHRKPKPEPVEIELSVPTQGCSPSSDAYPQKCPNAVVPSDHLTAASSTDFESPPTVLCDFCGLLFDTRKALSCHVRAHLRQLGLTWSINTSPIDLLKEYMRHGGKLNSESMLRVTSASSKATWTPEGSKSCNSPLDYSLKAQSPSGKRATSQNVVSGTSCELCGFYFENRKALASHARAHLRQLGLNWKVDGGSHSPIEVLSAWIQSEPAKVAEITRRYHVGFRHIKKSHRTVPSPPLSTDSDSVPGSSLKPLGQLPEHRLGREELSSTGGSSRVFQEQFQGRIRTKAEHSDIGAQSPRGHHPPKHSASTREENQDTNSQQAPRSGSIPALLPKPPLTPLVKLMGKVYSLKCRFCEEVFEGPLTIQEKWIIHMQKHILDLGYKGKVSPPVAPVEAPALVDPVAV
ncbi:hypothetical protein LDENG_00281690 [Lucifuga dentata]|nr:hypothetical protein LDENG_00281690 [Lucifuga dentata]